LQELPVSFFNANKAGDLISRLNNDTDKLNQFFSQSLMQFVGSLFIMAGAAVFLLTIHPRLGLAALAPALVLLVFTRALSPWVKAKNAASLRSTGGLSAEIQESLDNFKVVIAFNRRDYFRARFKEANDANYAAAVGTGVANNIFTPVYGLCANVAQLVVVAYGLFLVMDGQVTIGLLISFISYTTRFYDPLRQLASLWANFQTAMAGWDRVSDILSLKTTLAQVPAVEKQEGSSVLEFKGVHFHYGSGKEVLHNIDLALEAGKTYALVGPTGGGKTTTASLMARLYDPTEGTILLQGKDIRSYDARERAQKIGFILQEPFLFSGTVKENILYGNERYKDLSDADLQTVIDGAHLDGLIKRFDKGLQTEVAAGGDSISLGQKQLIAFVRAALREPDLLILDEATANIDTVTEQLLEDILKHLPAKTTRVIIAHRLNTIENADEIFFVNDGEVTRAGSMQDALELLLEGKRSS
jgi:ATP-binding cassette subfamily B protein